MAGMAADGGSRWEWMAHKEKEHNLVKGRALRIMSIVRFFRLEQPDNTVSLRSVRIGKRHYMAISDPRGA